MTGKQIRQTKYKKKRRKKKTRKKRGGDAERPPITLNKQQFINMIENNPDKVYKIIRNLRTEGMDDPDNPDYGFNVWYNGKIEYEGFDEDWGGDVFGFTMYDEDGDEIRWSDIYPALKTGPDTDALDYEWINIKDAGQPIKFVGGKRRKKNTRKKRGGWSRDWAGNKDEIGLYYNCWYSPNDVKYREGMTITGKWPGKENIDRWKIKKMMDSRQYDPILLMEDIPSGKEFKVYAQQLCSKGYVAPNIPTNAAGGKRRKKHRTRKKRGGTGEPNDGLIYARDFVNVAQEPENGWANWRWDPTNPIPELKVPIGSKYILYTYNDRNNDGDDDDNEPSINIIELQSQEPYYFGNSDGTPSIAINFKIVGEHAGYTFKPEDWNKEFEHSTPEIGTHEEAAEVTDIEWPYAPTVYVIEPWVEPPTRVSNLPNKPIPKPPKSPHPAGPIEIPKSKTILPDMSKIHKTKLVSAAAGGKNSQKTWGMRLSIRNKLRLCSTYESENERRSGKEKARTRTARTRTGRTR